MLKVIWNGAVLAESDRTESVEGFDYFPPESLHREYLRESDIRTTCPWKGRAHYYDVVVNGRTNPSAAWTYPEPGESSRRLAGWVAFWRGVQVVQGTSALKPDR